MTTFPTLSDVDKRAAMQTRAKTEADPDLSAMLLQGAAWGEEVARLRKALQPSGYTKAAYIFEIVDPETKRRVSWTAIKMVMKMIADLAALEVPK